MASALVKKPCIKCNKGGGVTTCDGCQQSFCIKHIIEHRQELATQLDNVGQEHDVFRRDLTQETLGHPLLIHIDEWEQEAITKIQVAAETARADLRMLIDERKTKLTAAADKMTSEMQAGRELEDYTETDLLRWTEELKELRQVLETELQIGIVEDENEATCIHMIGVRERQQIHARAERRKNLAASNIVCEETPAVTQERFRNFAGKIALTEGGLLATCIGTYWDGSNVYGTRLYASGHHEIRFRIDYKGSNNLFFGIKTTNDDIHVQTLTSPYVYGWWELDQVIESVSGHRVHNDRGIRTGDEITLTLNCENREIYFDHHRINTITRIPVDLQRCPLPWQIVVTLRSTGDSVRIIQ